MIRCFYHKAETVTSFLEYEQLLETWTQWDQRCLYKSEIRATIITNVLVWIFIHLWQGYPPIPTSRPTDATRDRFLFSVYTYTTLHVSSVKRPSSGVPHCTYSLQFLCLSVRGTVLLETLVCKKFLQDSATDGQTQKLEAVCTVRDSWWWAFDARNM
jgi:hypothetical protein